MSDTMGQLVALLQQLQGQPRHPQVAALDRLAPQNVGAPAPQQAAQYDSNVGYMNQYNTQLTPQEEQAYQAWGQQQGAQRPDKRNPAQDTYDYDMRGFWKAYGGNPQFAANGHAGDQFKKPNHPTFSSMSQYSTPEAAGGTWKQLPNGSWTFAPSPQNLKFNDAGDLQQYFAKEERGNKLVLPQQQYDQNAPQISREDDAEVLSHGRPQSSQLDLNMTPPPEIRAPIGPLSTPHTLPMPNMMQNSPLAIPTGPQRT